MCRFLFIGGCRSRFPNLPHPNVAIFTKLATLWGGWKKTWEPQSKKKHHRILGEETPTTKNLIRMCFIALLIKVLLFLINQSCIIFVHAFFELVNTSDSVTFECFGTSNHLGSPWGRPDGLFKLHHRANCRFFRIACTYRLSHFVMAGWHMFSRNMLQVKCDSLEKKNGSESFLIISMFLALCFVWRPEFKKKHAKPSAITR